MEPTEEIDRLIDGLSDWRGPMLATIRRVIHEADPEVVEEWKYMGSPCWYHDGMIAVGNAFNTSVKLCFLNGASLPDPDGLFNDELKGNQRRAIKYFEGDSIDEDSLKAAVRSAIALNQSRQAAKKKKK